MTDNRVPRARRVLITGISGEVAGALAARLEADDTVEYVAGLDQREPRRDLRRTEFIRADLRNPLVARVIESTGVDTLVHHAITTTPGQAGGRARMKELNVIGTMQLLAAAQRAPRLRKTILKSTTAVYGSDYRDPALFREDAMPAASVRAGYAKDAVEVEGYARGFGRRRADVALTILRFANLVGPTVETPLTRYFALPVVPTVLGYDPRIQLCHEDDAVEILYRACVEDHPGIFNVAGPGIIYLSQAIRIAGRPSAPLPIQLMNGVGALMRRTGRVDFSPDQLQFLLYGRVGDTARLEAEFGHRVRYSTRAAFEDFLAARGIERLVDVESMQEWEASIHSALTRSRATRATQESS